MLRFACTFIVLITKFLMIFFILELVTFFKAGGGGGGTARVDHEPRGHEEKKFGNHWSKRIEPIFNLSFK